jgi:hypothetical protein
MKKYFGSSEINEIKNNKIILAEIVEKYHKNTQFLLGTIIVTLSFLGTIIAIFHVKVYQLLLIFHGYNWFITIFYLICIIYGFCLSHYYFINWSNIKANIQIKIKTSEFINKLKNLMCVYFVYVMLAVIFTMTFLVMFCTLFSDVADGANRGAIIQNSMEKFYQLNNSYPTNLNQLKLKVTDTTNFSIINQKNNYLLNYSNFYLMPLTFTVDKKKIKLKEIFDEE